jgi:hypothetical protein
MHLLVVQVKNLEKYRTLSFATGQRFPFILLGFSLKQLENVHQKLLNVTFFWEFLFLKLFEQQKCVKYLKKKNFATKKINFNYQLSNLAFSAK